MTNSRRDRLAAMLEADPADPFLHYTLALEDLKVEDGAAGRERLRNMLGQFPDYVPAYFRLGQALAENSEPDAAKVTLTEGIEVAKRVGDAHAVGEMTEFLAELNQS